MMCFVYLIYTLEKNYLKYTECDRTTERVMLHVFIATGDHEK